MDDTNRKREAARHGHNACPGCGGMYTSTTVDGSKCGGLPGVNYKVCGNCGHARVITKKRRPNVKDISGKE